MIGKGGNLRVIVDQESAYGTAKTTPAGRIIPVISTSLECKQNLIDSEELNGNRNPKAPSVGNVSMSGDLVVVARADSLGWFLKMAVGDPTSVEAFKTASNIMSGAPTLTIASGGGYTFSAAQTAAAVGDRVIYELSGTRYVGYIITRTDSTTGTMGSTFDGGAAASAITGATVMAIIANKGAGGTVSISSGVATFATSPTTRTDGQMLIYDETSPTYAKISSWLTSTTANVVDLSTGLAPTDASAKTVEFVGAASLWKHTYKIDPDNELPSFLVEQALTSLSTPYYEVFRGCKIGKMSFTAGDEGEVKITFSLTGRLSEKEDDAYDSNAVSLTGSKFQNFQASLKEDGSAVGYVKTLETTLDNGLDDSLHTIGDGGAISDLPEGLAQVSGKISTVFKDASVELYDRADGVTESSIILSCANSDGTSLVMTMPRMVYSRTSPKISGPKAIVVDLE
ncbi:TPA: hypothetical protein DDW35_11530, partial [Candidatus Sumerlaeota bacterium]|nr:hypothetical protein [Candidatus Sumerlaeota bacterium]